MTRRSLLGILFGLGLAFAVASPGTAEAQGAMVHTGDAVRVKSVGPFTAKVYSIRHDMVEPPSPKSKQAIIDSEKPKQFTWLMLRDVDAKKIKDALRKAYTLNGNPDSGSVEKFVAAFGPDGKDVPEWEKGRPASVVISFANGNTTIKVEGKGAATVAGVPFMKSTWGIWFGNIPEQPSMGDQLMSLLK